MATLTAGEARTCCQSGSALRVIEQTEKVIIRQCVAPAADGLMEIDGVRVCGRRHFRATLIGLDAAAVASRLGG